MINRYDIITAILALIGASIIIWAAVKMSRSKPSFIKPIHHERPKNH